MTHTPVIRPLILLVEDDTDARLLYARELEMAGLAVIQAADGDAALRLAVTRRPAVVVSDLALPGLDGAALTEQLQTDEQTRHIPVIALTGWAGPDVAEAAARSGVVELLTKPCSAERLVSTVLRYLGPTIPVR